MTATPEFVRGVDFVGIPTHDIAAAARFYGDTLGLPRSVYLEDRHFSEFETGIDPMVVIRWKDNFGVLEEAIDSTEKAAQILEGIVIKNW